eukprot:COSAG06_NODE_483_length_15127_cov_38.842960_8_plen_163_part_00
MVGIIARTFPDIVAASVTSTRYRSCNHAQSGLHATVATRNSCTNDEGLLHCPIAEARGFAVRTITMRRTVAAVVALKLLKAGAGSVFATAAALRAPHLCHARDMAGLAIEPRRADAAVRGALKAQLAGTLAVLIAAAMPSAGLVRITVLPTVLAVVAIEAFA